MTLISKNPYRILGLLADASEKEIQKQISVIKRYAEVGKTKDFDYDFPFLGSFSRDSSAVQEAASSIEQEQNRVVYGLFWFVNKSDFDAIALDHLKNDDIKKAMEIWGKVAEATGAASIKKCSAINNLATLNLGLTTTTNSFSLKMFQYAVQLKGRLFAPENWSIFTKSIAGEHIVVNSDALIIKFIDEILHMLKPYLDKPQGLTPEQLLVSFSNYPQQAQNHLAGHFTEQPVSLIESAIEEVRTKRGKHPEFSKSYGKMLYNDTSASLALLKKIWGVNNQYQMLANKLANEILQCAIDFFNARYDSGDDPGEETKDIMKLAQKLGPTGTTKNRLEENLGNVQGWIDESAEDEVLNKIKNDLEFISNRIKEFQSISPAIDTAKKLINDCRFKLMAIRDVLGGEDKTYLSYSSAVVGNAQGMVVHVVNARMAGLKDRPGAFDLDSTRTIINGALVVIKALNAFDMDAEIRTTLHRNEIAITDLKNQLDEIDFKRQISHAVTNTTTKGC